MSRTSPCAASIGRRNRRQPVPGYLEEIDAAAASDTETFVAVKAGVENWRWAGVPFYLRTGKRLPSRASEIVVQFRTPPHELYPESAARIHPNRLVCACSRTKASAC